MKENKAKKAANSSQIKQIKLLACDFDGVMTDNNVTVDEDGKESVICNRSDSLGIELLKKKGIEIIVISKEKNKVIKARCDKLKIPCIQGINDKLPILKKELAKRGISKDDACFIGNDITDTECIKYAGIGIAVMDSYPEAKKAANIVTKKKGGEGAVREVADMILKGSASNFKKI